jgi:hypothetical protein
MANKQWLVIRWDILDGAYLVGPFDSPKTAADWGSDNDGCDPRWQVWHADPTEPLTVREPGPIPPLREPEKLFDSDRWAERPNETGNFYLLMVEPEHLAVGPFHTHQQAFSWGIDQEERDGDPSWQVVWLDDPSEPLELHSPAESALVGFV